VAGFALLAWASRNALPGTPVADDYQFLARVRLAAPLDFFDGGGFAYYWRPLTRQVYYSALGDALLASPALVGALHGLALVGLAFLLWRIGRHALPPAAALSFAMLPLVAESARLLLVWPTCAQPLFGTLLAAAAIAAALAGRWGPAALAFLAALLSYEQALAAAPALAAIAWRRSATPGERLRRLLPFGVALTAWAVGLAVARARGVQWPGGGALTDPGAGIAYAVTVVANLDLVPSPARALLLAAQGALIALAAVLARGRAKAPRERGRPRPAGPSAATLAGCAAIGVAGLVPALLAPDLWAPRHAFLPSLYLGYAVIGLCARAGPAFAPAWVGLRAIALLLAPAASAIVVDEPFGDARTSFPELVRLQRIVAATHGAIVESNAARAGGASYWSVPRRSTVAFADGRAQQVWAGDSTFRWGWLSRPLRLDAQRAYPILSFDVGVADPVRVVDPAVVEDYFRATALSLDIRNAARIDSLLAAASVRNGPRPAAVLDEMERLRAGLAAMGGNVALAESLMRSSERRYGTKADHVAIAGWVALARGDERRAAELVAVCLKYEPDHPTGLALRATLAARARRAAEAAGRPAAAP
jgi:hypothetical protein